MRVASGAAECAGGGEALWGGGEPVMAGFWRMYLEHQTSDGRPSCGGVGRIQGLSNERALTRTALVHRLASSVGLNNTSLTHTL